MAIRRGRRAHRAGEAAVLGEGEVMPERTLASSDGLGIESRRHAASVARDVLVHPGRILLVDDEETFGCAAAKMLRKAGFEVSLAPDYRLALRILESPQPLDLLITDVVMPDRVNGFALARMARMRRLDLRILYITAHDVPAGEAIGKILRKPIPLDVLVREAGMALAADGDSSPERL
jgi:CheY-like chemotaxis protein